MEPEAMTMTSRAAPPAWPPERLPVILDTDVGGEPDDAMSLVIAARELPELALVVTSDEMSGQRARFARSLLDRAGRPDVPVVAGQQLSATPCYLATGLTPSWVASQPREIAPAVAAACGGTGGAAHWIGIGPLSNLAAILGDSPALAGRLFITQLAGTLNRPEGSRRRPPAGALPPRNFRLDPRAAQRVLATARHLRLVAFGAAFRRAAEVTATSPVFTSLAGVAEPPWAEVLAAHFRQFFARYHPAVVPASPLALSAALGLPFTSFAPALVTVSATGRIAERRAGGGVLLSGDSDDLAFTRWLQARLRPVRWAAHRPRAGAYS
jgi:inosine-uridine nucleoside N-ribohydrolase